MAASGTSVTVLAPNGRRLTVKVSPSTPLLQVLEDVCKKQGFNPDDHGLKFQRTTVDLTLPWRFANLPNNAKLEMVQSTRKQAGADSQVRIALQMEDGFRLQGSFSCGQSLWELLTHFPQLSVMELSDSGSIPVCVHMRDEVSGEDALKRATLKSLGLTGGTAIIRFLLKNNKAPREEDDREATETMPTTAVATETTTSLPSQPDRALSHTETSTAELLVNNSSHRGPIETHPAPPPTPASSTLPVKQEVVPNSQDAAQLKFPPGQKRMSEEEEEKPGPSGLNSDSSSSSSVAPSAPFIPFTGGGQRLGGPGPPGGGVSGQTLPSSSSSSSSSPSALTAAVESPKAKKAKSSQSCSNKPVEREPLIYHLDSMSRRHDQHENLPDEFFEVTVDDVRKCFAQLKSKRKLLEEAPMMTKALREAQMKEKMERYPKVVLRVQFPDRHVLQGFFRPLETVEALMRFVRSHMEDPHLSFYLFTTPPKSILDDPSATLFQADLFPVALLHFGSDIKRDFYIKREMRESPVSALQANESIASCMLQGPPSSTASEEPLPPLEPRADTKESTPDDPDPSAHTQAPKPARSDPGKVPKWLKLPGKK